MKTAIKLILVMVWLLLATAVFAQTEAKKEKEKTTSNKTMNTYVIERQIPEAGKMSAADLQGADLQGISKKSCSVLTELGSQIEWVQSYVTDNKVFCIYKAENEAILRTHAENGGFPINAINKLSTVISPATATAKLEEIMN
jgi:hypothetical protein